MKDRELAAVLVEEGLMSPERARDAVEESQLSGHRLDTLCLLRNWVPEEALLKAVGKAFKSRTASRSVLVHIPPRVLGLVPARVAEHFHVVPFQLEGKTLSVAALDPTDLLVEDELRLLTGCGIRSHAALEARIYQALAAAYGVAIPPMIERWLDGASTAPKTSGDLSTRPLRRPTPPPQKHRERGRSIERTGPPAGGPADPPEALELSSEELGEFPGLARLADPGDGGETGGAPADPPSAHLTTQVRDFTGGPPGPAMDDPGLDPEERLGAAAIALGRAEMRDDIADVLLAFCRPHFQRRALFILRRDTVVGWRGEGRGVEEETLRAVAIPISEPSVFQPLLHGTAFWLGPLASMPRNIELALGLGGEPTGGCTVFPIQLKGRVVCFLWGDNFDDGLRAVPVPQLRRLTAKAGLAFETYLLRAKIRSI